MLFPKARWHLPDQWSLLIADFSLKPSALFAESTLCRMRKKYHLRASIHWPSYYCTPFELGLGGALRDQPLRALLADPRWVGHGAILGELNAHAVGLKVHRRHRVVRENLDLRLIKGSTCV